MPRYQVLRVSRYDFKDKESGRSVSGAKVTALGESLSTPDTKGHEILTFAAPLALFDRFSQVPATYELELIPKMSGGKVTLELKDCALVPKG